MPVTVARTLIVYFVVVAAMRLMGKRQLGELQPSELVSTILISNLASISIETPEIPLAASILPVFLIVSIEICISAIGVKKQNVATLLSGRPKVVIRDGVIDQQALEELRFTADDLLEALREKDVFSPREVKLAMVETGGTISLFRNVADSPYTKKDAGMDIDGPAQPPVPVVVNGSVDAEALRYCHKSQDWLLRMLGNEKMALKDVFLLLCTEQEEYWLVPKK